ncbi:MAG: coenzyme F420-0:L-glutamate ligase [Rhodospirillaceae bacterium]|nr:coenzyme F420-0:L-glutamate ligase [Rhodospirillaceae bacterium]
MSSSSSANCSKLTFTALRNVPLVHSGDDLVSIVIGACAESNEKLCDGDILLLAQKIVSKSEGRSVSLVDVIPSKAALVLAKSSNKDPRLVEVILRESNEVIRQREGALIVENRQGVVLANAGIDMSNVEQESGDTVLLLPKDPNLSCVRLKDEIRRRTGTKVGVVINDSLGRAFRNGTVGAALGAAGVPTLVDLSGTQDLFGRPLRVTQVAIADELAAAASLLMGQADEGQPIVLLRGFRCDAETGTAQDLIRAKEQDLFREPKQ